MDQSQIQPTRPQDAGGPEEQHTEKKSLFHKMKGKARKIKNSVLSKNSHAHDDDHHTDDGQHDRDLSPKNDGSEEFHDDEMDEPLIQHDPIHDSSAVTGATAAKVGSTENHGINHGNKVDSSVELPTSIPPVSRDADERVQDLDRKPVTFKEDPIIHRSTPADYQSEFADPTRAVHDSSAVTSATTGKVGSTENHGINYGNKEDFSAELPTSTPPMSRDADERVQGLDRKPVTFEEDPIIHRSNPADYQSEVADPTGAVHDSSAVTGSTSGKVGSTENHGIDYGNKEDFFAELPTSTPPVSRDADEGVQGLDRKPVTLKEDPIIHGSIPAKYQSEVVDPTTGAVHDSSAVTGATADKVGSTDNHEINYWNTDDFSAELPTSTPPVSRDVDEGVQGADRKQVTLEEDPIIHGSTPANYQSEVADPTGAVHDSSAVTGATAGKVGSTENHGINYGNKEDFSAELPTSTPPVSRDADEGVQGLDRKPVTLKEDPIIHGSTPANYQSEVADLTGADHEEVKPSPMVESFEKLSVGDKKDSKMDQTPRGTPDDDLSSELSRTEAPQSPSTASTGGSYTDKLSYAPSAVTGSAISAKNVVTSKLGYGGGATTPAAETELGDDNYVPITEKEAEPNKGYVASVTEKLAPVYDRVSSVGATIVSKVPGTGSRDAYPETETSTPMETDTPLEADSGADKGYVAAVTERLAPVYNVVAGAGTTIMSKVPGTGAGSPTTETETDTRVEREIGIGTENEAANKGYAAGVTEKLTPVYNKVSSAGTTVMSKFTGSGASAEKEGASDKGVPVTECMSEKTKPNEDDKALSDSIAEALYLKSKDSDEVKPAVKKSDEVERQLGTGDEHNSGNVSGELKMSPGNTGGVVDYVKSWFGKGNEDVAASSPKGQTPHEETGERRLQESSN